MKNTLLGSPKALEGRGHEGSLHMQVQSWSPIRFPLHLGLGYTFMFSEMGERGLGGARIERDILFSLPDVTILRFPSCISFYNFLPQFSSLFGSVSISSFWLGLRAALWEMIRGIQTMGLAQEFGIS